MNCEHRWSEEEIVDFVMGRLSTEKKAAFERHIDSCSVCRSALSEWKMLMAMEEEEAVPTARVKRRLFKKIRKKNGFRLTGLKETATLAASFCLLAFFLFGTGLFKSAPHTGGSSHPVGGATGTGPSTQIRYVPVSKQNVKGYVWMNGNTDEMMLYLNGLKNIEGKDYQAWLVSSEKHSNAGLIKINHGMGQLYFQGPQLEHAQNIVVTVEPLGGSLEETGPKKVLIQLNR